MSRISVLCTLLFIIALAPATTRADPIVITSGTLTVTGPLSGPQFTLFGDNFFASGSGAEPGSSAPQVLCRPCLSGSVIVVNGVFVGSSLGGGTTIINGVERSGGFAGAFTLTGPPIEVPFTLSNLTITSPFTFSGFLIGCPQSCVIGPTIFSVSMVGSGTATVDLIFSGFFGGLPGFTFQKVTYNFEIPEPTSILLLGAGLAALATGLKRRYRPRG